MFVAAAKVRSSYFVAEVLELLELRYGNFQCLTYLPQACVASTVRRAGDLL